MRRQGEQVGTAERRNGAAPHPEAWGGDGCRRVAAPRHQRVIDQPVPGEWLSDLGPCVWGRLVRLAQAHLVGHEYLAEDAVSRALIRWRCAPHAPSNARIETVVRSEARSLLRSERRRWQREGRVSADRTSPFCRSESIDQVDLQGPLVQQCQQHQITLTATEVRVFDLLCAGESMSEVARLLDLPRSQVRAIRARWQVILRQLHMVSSGGITDA